MEKELEALEVQMEEKTKVLLALDQSTSATGWCLFVDNELKDYGLIKQSGFEVERIDKMKEWKRDYDPNWILGRGNIFA